MRQVNQILITVLLLAALGIGGYFATQQVRSGSVNKKLRQSVFLTNGQVYFGHVTRETSKVIALEDIYYLQVQQSLQPPNTKETPQPQISLVKLGNELHGPKDHMDINRDQVLFIEDMKDDSKVNQAIAEYIKNGSQPVAPSPAASPQPTK